MEKKDKFLEYLREPDFDPKLQAKMEEALVPEHIQGYLRFWTGLVLGAVEEKYKEIKRREAEDDRLCEECGGMPVPYATYGTHICPACSGTGRPKK